MLQLTHENVTIYVETLCALARDARAERNDGALEFVGRYLKTLLPASALEAFREELRRLPQNMPATGAYCVTRNSNAVAELEQEIAARDVQLATTPLKPSQQPGYKPDVRLATTPQERAKFVSKSASLPV